MMLQMPLWPLFLLAVFSAPLSVTAAANPPLPELLKKDGKPIDAYCFARLLEGGGGSKPGLRIDVGQCGRPPNIAVEKVAAAPDHGYEYSETIRETGDVHKHNQIRYQYVGMAGDAAVVSFYWNGECCSTRSGVYSWRREGDSLVLVREWASGDRCQGGIGDVRVEGGVPVIELDVTPADFLTMVPNGNPHHFENGADLDDSAMSCIGTTTTRNGMVVGFTPDGESVRNLVGSGADVDIAPVQACFGKLMAGAAFGRNWNRAQIEAFMQHFNRACATAKHAEAAHG